MENIKLSQNFTLSEFLYSQTAERLKIKNVPDTEQVQRMVELCERVLQPCRDVMGTPITITSGFRSLALNEALHGAKSSQHCRGEAADVVCKDTAKLFYVIKENLIFDQLIWEFGDSKQPNWVHVSYRKGKNRKEVLRARRTVGGGTYYTKWQ